MQRNHTVILATLVAIVAAIGGALLARSILVDGRASQVTLANATLLEPPRPLPEFSLLDHTGSGFGPQRLRGHWTLMFFGFVSCPDICPQTLGILAQVEKQLATLPEAQRPQVVLISVDPQRDTPAQLSTYVSFFSPAFTGVTGTQDAIEKFTRALGVPVAISRVSSGGYSVDHSASIFLIDPSGAQRALMSAPHSPELIVSDYRTLVGAR